MSESRSASDSEEQVLALCVQWLQARCGEGVPLIVDTLLMALESPRWLSSSSLASLLKAEVCDAIELLCFDPMLNAIQGQKEVMVNTVAPGTATAPADCRLCFSDRPLSMERANRSGSMAEGLGDLVFGLGGTSDFDVMLQLDAGCRWMADPVVEAGSEPPLISPGLAPQLWAERTDSPGFVKLYWARTSQCSHSMSRLALKASSIRELMQFFPLILRGDGMSFPGPAVNINFPRPGLQDGGVDHVPSLHLPWWPDMQGFLNRRRMTDFPPAAARHNICQYGIHLVPTGRPGSRTEAFEWRMSFSRAEVLTAHCLSAEQRATVKAVKSMKTLLTRENPALKSYYMKTALLWLVQDEPSHRWRSVTDAVFLLLDWLERHLIAGRLPCFFWDEINLLSGLGQEKVEDMIRTVKMMRSRAIRMLLTSCLSEFRPQKVVLALGNGPEPLSERDLRLRLARLLVTEGVMMGIMFRPTAPCWYYWGRCFIPPLVRQSNGRLLEWKYRQSSSAYHQQCLLLRAMLVAPDDLVAGIRMTSHDSGLFTWDVTPLMALLTKLDLDVVLGDSAAVAAWCRQQLCRPPEERPAGLTAELETPRGRAELLLQPELLLRAIADAATDAVGLWQNGDRDSTCSWKNEYPLWNEYQLCRDSLQSQLKIPTRQWQALLQRMLPRENGSRVAATIHLFRCRAMYLLSGDRLKRKYDAFSTRRADSWQLRQFVVRENPTTDLSPGVERCASGGERWRPSKLQNQERKQEEQQEQRFQLLAQQQCCSYITQRDDLVWRHSQQRERQAQRRLREQRELTRRHLQEQAEKRDERHRQELMELKQRHDQERKDLIQRQLQELDDCYELAWKMFQLRAAQQNVCSSTS